MVVSGCHVVQAVENSPLTMWHAGDEPHIGWITWNKVQRVCTIIVPIDSAGRAFLWI